MYVDEFQKILMETSPEEKAAILREVLEESGIPYVLNQGGFEFPNLFEDEEESFEKKNELKVGPARTLRGPFTSSGEDRHSRQYSLQIKDCVTEYGFQMDYNAA